MNEWICRAHCYRQLSYCWQLSVSGGGKYRHTQKDGCGCVRFVLHFTLTLKTSKEWVGCCFQLLYVQIPYLLDVSFLWKLLPFFKFFSALNNTYIHIYIWTSVAVMLKIFLSCFCSLWHAEINHVQFWKFSHVLKLNRAVFFRTFLPAEA